MRAATERDETMKRKLKIMLALAILAAAVCCGAALAAAPTSGQCGDDVYWSYDDGAGVLTISGTGPMWNYDNSNYFDIGWYLYRYGSSIVIEDGVTAIGDWVFFDAKATSVTIPDSVTAIGEAAFYNCRNLSDVTIPESVTSIGSFAFLECESLTSITIPDSVTSIGIYAFSGCTGLKSVDVLNASAEFGEGVFHACFDDLVIYGLAGSTAQTYAEACGIPFRPLPLGDALSGSGTAGDPWKISSTADWNHVALALKEGTDTSGNYFRLTANISVSTVIGTEANPFHGHVDGAGHTLTVSLTATESERGPFAFVSNASFEHIRVAGTITASVHDAGGLVGSATNCSVTDCASNIHIIASGTNGHAGFVGAIIGEDSVSIDGSVFTGRIDGNSASYCAGLAGRGGGFADNSIYNGTILGDSNNNTFLRMRDRAENCYYLNAEGIHRIKGQQAWAVTADEGVSIDFGEGKTYSVSNIIAYPVGLSYNGTFYAGHEETVKFCLSATPTDGFAAFFTANAGTLTEADGVWSLVMPNMDVVISAFYEPLSGSCGDSLTWTFDQADGTLTINGSGTMYDYTTVQAGWSVYLDHIKAVVIEDGVTSIGKSAFQNCRSLTGVTLPDSVTSIGASAFRRCSSLTGATIPAGVTSFGANVFADCASGFILYGQSDSVAEAYANYYGIPFEAPVLTGTCGDNVVWTLDPAVGMLTISGSGAMADFSSAGYPGWYAHHDRITTVTIEDGVTQIGAYAFIDLSEMKTVHIPGSVSAIGRLAFYGCSGISDVVFHDGLTSIGNNAFSNCSGLTGIVIPDSVACIGYQAFQGCTSLVSAKILNPDVTIGTRAFANCAASLVIIGFQNSTSHSFANRYDIPFVSIPAPTFFLPSGLVFIEGDAFSGIAAVSVYIPDTVSVITGNPFAESMVAYIYGFPGSAAQSFARAQGYTFIAVDNDWIASH